MRGRGFGTAEKQRTHRHSCRAAFRMKRGRRGAARQPLSLSLPARLERRGERPGELDLVGEPRIIRGRSGPGHHSGHGLSAVGHHQRGTGLARRLDEIGAITSEPRDRNGLHLLCGHLFGAGRTRTRSKRRAVWAKNSSMQESRSAAPVPGSQPVVSGDEQRQREPDQHEQRAACAQEIREPVAGGGHHQQVGLVAHRRREAQVAAE